MCICSQVDDEIHRYEWAIRSTPSSTPDKDDAIDGKVGEAPALASSAINLNLSLLVELRLQRAALKERHTNLLATHHRQFHPIWGQLLKTGHQNSRFAHQVERYACLYTSHVSNLSYYSPETSFRGRIDLLAHEDPGDGFSSED
jgi:5'-nucleotidase